MHQSNTSFVQFPRLWFNLFAARISIKALTSAEGRRQFSVENAYSVSHGNAPMRQSANNVLNVGDAPAMALPFWAADVQCRPAAIAVHDDGNVPRNHCSVAG